MADIDFNYFLARKYALLAQGADAQTTNAASGAIQANAQATAATAAAGLDNVRAGLLPAESKSQIGLQGAQASLIGQQASVVVPEANARIADLTANTALTGTQTKVLTREKLTPFSSLFGSTGLPTLGGAGTPYRLPVGDDPLPRRRVGETEATYMDRINGVGAFAR